MANWNKLTARQFEAIKTLLKGGATQKEAADYMNVSPNTAFWVSKAETFEEYMQNQTARHLERKQVAAIKAKEKEAENTPATETTPAQTQPAPVQKVIHEQSVTIQATHYMMEELRKTNELLALISNKLSYIVDQLT